MNELTDHQRLIYYLVHRRLKNKFLRGIKPSSVTYMP